MERESMHYDAVIVGAGPAGLAAAIRLKQRASGLSVCVIEKGSEVGAHILSGAVLETRALDELFPDWRDRGAPVETPVREERFLLLTETRGFALPHALLPPVMRNRGNYIVSLGNLCRWLAGEAEALGVEIYPGFAAAEALYDDSGAVAGVATGDMGISRSGEPGPNHQRGVELRGRITLFAEGCRGNLGKALAERFDLRAGVQPQTYGLGLKELWEVTPDRRRPGLAMHSVGWPLNRGAYGGSFCIISTAVRSPWVSSSASTTPIPISIPTKSSSASRLIRRSAKPSMADAASPTGRGRSTKAGRRACRNSPSPAAR